MKPLLLFSLILLISGSARGQSEDDLIGSTDLSLRPIDESMLED